MSNYRNALHRAFAGGKSPDWVAVKEPKPRPQDLDRDDAADFDEPARSDEIELEEAIDDALAAQYDDDPSPYLGNYSED